MSEECAIPVKYKNKLTSNKMLEKIKSLMKFMVLSVLI